MADEIGVGVEIGLELGRLLAEIVVGIVAAPEVTGAFAKTGPLHPPPARLGRDHDHVAEAMAINGNRLEAVSQPAKILPTAADEKIAGQAVHLLGRKTTSCSLVEASRRNF